MLHKCLSAFCSPLFSVPLVISPLAFLPFLRSSCGYLFCPFSYGVFSFSTSSFSGFGLLHSPAYSSPSACSLGVPGTSVLPSSGVSIGWGVVSVEFCTGIASGSYWCFFSLHCLATSVCASSCGSFFLSSCFPASGCLRVLSPDSSLLPSSSLTWPVSSAPGWGSPPLVSVVPCYLWCSAWRSVIVCCLFQEYEEPVYSYSTYPVRRSPRDIHNICSDRILTCRIKSIRSPARWDWLLQI